MKKYFFILCILSSVLLAQQYETKSILELKNSIRQTDDFKINYKSGEETISKKNPGLAILFSFLLPGMGELYAGSYDSGIYFTIADAVCWGAVIGFNTYGNWQKENYRAFAASKAGVVLDGKDDKYLSIIGDYLGVDEYNQAMELVRDYTEVYNTTTHYWKWADNNQRREYRELWISSEQSYNNIRFAAGALILNRLISAINAVRLVAAHNKQIPKEDNVNISFSVENKITLPPSLIFNIQASF